VHVRSAVCAGPAEQLLDADKGITPPFPIIHSRKIALSIRVSRHRASRIRG
jgi:hypothetical protein